MRLDFWTSEVGGCLYGVGMYRDLPEDAQLSYLVGEIVRNDTYDEHEARVLWGYLFDAGLGAGTKRERDFGRLLPQLRTMLHEATVPQKFQRLATQVVDLAILGHRYRRDLVHDLLLHGGYTRGKVWSATGAFPARELSEIEERAHGLLHAAYRMRGLWITAPHWVGGPVEDELNVPDLQSWSRVAMGHIADIPGRIEGTPGKALEPDGGWRSPDVASDTED